MFMNGSHDAGNTYSSTAHWHAYELCCICNYILYTNMCDAIKTVTCDYDHEKLVLHPTPSIKEKIDERTSRAHSGSRPKNIDSIFVCTEC